MLHSTEIKQTVSKSWASRINIGKPESKASHAVSFEAGDGTVSPKQAGFKELQSATKEIGYELGTHNLSGANF